MYATGQSVSPAALLQSVGAHRHGVVVGQRVEIDRRSEKIGHKIRDAELQKIPYMLVAGKKEIESGGLAVRHPRRGQEGVSSPAEIGKKILAEVAARS